jgi:predicted lipid carrier protein YhbT
MDLALVSSRIQQTLDPLLARVFSPLNLSLIVTRAPLKLNCAVVQKLLNYAFTQQICEGDFDFLQKRILQVEITDARLFIGLGFSQNKLICHHFERLPCQSDVTLSIDALNAIQLIQQEVDPDALFFQRKLKVNGDTELAHQVKNTIDTLDPTVIPAIILKLIANYKLRVLGQK